MEKKNKAAVALGRLGGKKTAERGSEYYREINKKGMKKRIQAIKQKACERKKLSEVQGSGENIPSVADA